MFFVNVGALREKVQFNPFEEVLLGVHDDPKVRKPVSERLLRRGSLGLGGQRRGDRAQHRRVH